MGTVQDTASREPGYVALAMNSTSTSEGLRYMQNISSPDKRDMAATGIFQVVNNTEGRAAAEAFLDEAGLSDSVRELLKLAERY